MEFACKELCLCYIWNEKLNGRRNSQCPVARWLWLSRIAALAALSTVVVERKLQPNSATLPPCLSLDFLFEPHQLSVLNMPPDDATLHRAFWHATVLVCPAGFCSVTASR